MPEGASKGQVFEQDQLLPVYYKIRGWNQQGLPSKKKLEEPSLSI
jgi:aldehyde:ferredoxin oxidoreductase